jgi:ABC-type phosphate/phosphonate transport system ATPase subunit
MDLAAYTRRVIQLRDGHIVSDAPPEGDLVLTAPRADEQKGAPE